MFRRCVQVGYIKIYYCAFGNSLIIYYKKALQTRYKRQLVLHILKDTREKVLGSFEAFVPGIKIIIWRVEGYAGIV